MWVSRSQHQVRCHQQQIARSACRMLALTGVSIYVIHCRYQTRRAFAALAEQSPAVGLPMLSPAWCGIECQTPALETPSRPPRHSCSASACTSAGRQPVVQCADDGNSRCFRDATQSSNLSGSHTSARAMHCAVWPCMPHLGVQIIDIRYAQPQQLFTQACTLSCHISRPHALLHHSGR